MNFVILISIIEVLQMLDARYIGILIYDDVIPTSSNDSY